jgi:hypothetical protein
LIAYSDGKVRQEFTFVYAAEIEFGELKIDDESKEAAWLPLPSGVELPLLGCKGGILPPFSAAISKECSNRCGGSALLRTENPSWPNRARRLRPSPAKRAAENLILR